MRETKFKITDLKPGYISSGDIGDNLNPGYITLKNIYINNAGKPQKRLGWTEFDNIQQAGSYGFRVYNELYFGDKTGLDPVTDYTNNSVFQFRPDILFTRVKKENVNGSEIEYLDMIFFRRKEVEGVNVGVLIHKRIDNTNGLNVFERTITSPRGDEYFKGWGNVDIVNAGENIYIINSYIEKGVSREVRKYNLDSDTEHYAHNVSLQNGVHRDFMTGNANTTRGGEVKPGYQYVIVPVYNTDTISDYDKTHYIRIRTNVGIGRYGFHYLLQPKVPQQVDITINRQDTTFTDPYVVKYRIYRTKNYYAHPDIFEGYSDDTFDIREAPNSSSNLSIINVWSDIYKDAKRREEANDFLYYFVAQVDKPTDDGSNDFHLYTDKIKDENLGSVYTNAGYINGTTPFRMPTGRPWADFYGKEDFGIKASCGAYIHRRIWLGGDYENPNNVYISEIDKTDAYNVSVLQQTSTATRENMHKVISEIGGNVFVFMNRTIEVFRQTQNANTPYIRQTISQNYGIDSGASFAVFNDIGYFIYKSKLYSINSAGNITPVGGRINSVFSELANDNGAYVVMRINTKDRYILFIIRKTNGDVVNMQYYPETNIFNTVEGERDTFNTSSSTLTLNSNQENEYAILGYNYNEDLEREFGITKYGELVNRNNNYNDISLVTRKYVFPNYTFTGTANNTYPVKGIIERAFSFDKSSVVKWIKLYGTGKIKYQWKYDDDNYTDELEVTMTRQKGVDIPIMSPLCGTFYLKLIHDTTENIDLDYIEIVAMAVNRVKILNVEGGT